MKGLNLAEWAIKHKPVVYFFIFFILLGGLWSYSIWGAARIRTSPSVRRWCRRPGRARRRRKSPSR